MLCRHGIPLLNPLPLNGVTLVCSLSEITFRIRMSLNQIFQGFPCDPLFIYFRPPASLQPSPPYLCGNRHTIQKINNVRIFVMTAKKYKTNPREGLKGKKMINVPLMALFTSKDYTGQLCSFPLNNMSGGLFL